MHRQLITSTSEERITSADGTAIFMRSWRPDVTPDAVVVIVHGFNSHSGYYGWVAAQLTASRCAVYALDLRGRGHSDGERYFVESFREYLADVHAVVELARSREPGLPVFVLGHSAGGVISSVYALEHQDTARRPRLRELRVPGVCARPRARGRQGREPRRAAPARAASAHRRLLARSRGGPAR